MCFGRSSVFVINFLVLFATFAIIVMYSLLFSKIFSSLFDSYKISDDMRVTLTDFNYYFNVIITSKTTYCILLYMLLLPTVLIKDLKDLKIQSGLLFLGITAMILSLTAKYLYSSGSKDIAG